MNSKYKIVIGITLTGIIFVSAITGTLLYHSSPKFKRFKYLKKFIQNSLILQTWVWLIIRI